MDGLKPSLSIITQAHDGDSLKTGVPLRDQYEGSSPAEAEVVVEDLMIGEVEVEGGFVVGTKVRLLEAKHVTGAQELLDVEELAVTAGSPHLAPSVHRQGATVECGDSGCGGGEAA